MKSEIHFASVTQLQFTINFLLQTTADETFKYKKSEKAGKTLCFLIKYEEIIHPSKHCKKNITTKNVLSYLPSTHFYQTFLVAYIYFLVLCCNGSV